MLRRIEWTEISIEGLKASLKRKQGVHEVPVQILEDFYKLLPGLAKFDIERELAQERKLMELATEKLQMELAQERKQMELATEKLQRELAQERKQKETAEASIKWLVAQEQEKSKAMVAQEQEKSKAMVAQEQEKSKVMVAQERKQMELATEKLRRELAQERKQKETAEASIEWLVAQEQKKSKVMVAQERKQMELAMEKLQRKLAKERKQMKEATGKLQMELAQERKQTVRAEALVKWVEAREQEVIKAEVAQEQEYRKAVVAQERLKIRNEVKKELLKLKLALQQKEFELREFEVQEEFEQGQPEQRKPKQREPKEEEPEQEEIHLEKDLHNSKQDDLHQIKLKEAEVPSPKRIELPQDFKIRSTEISIHEKVGAGGFATIHKCRWQNSDYALKIFTAADVHELIKEIRNLVLLPRHPNIMLLVGFSIPKTNDGKDGSPMLVMELLDGDLHSLVCPKPSKKKHRLSRLWENLSGRQRGLSTTSKIDFIYQIAKGMLFLHNRKIFHGDLKGKNVLFKKHPGDSMQLKITDFGLSEKLIIQREHNIELDEALDCSAYSDHSSLGFHYGNAKVHGNVGTLRWMAPEVYGVTEGNMKPYSMKADVYSFSMTCVEILTRQHPFPDIRLPKTVKEHVKGGRRPDLSTMKDVPEALLKLVERCWDADPLRRPDFSEINSRMQELKKQFPIN